MPRTQASKTTSVKSAAKLAVAKATASAAKPACKKPTAVATSTVRAAAKPVSKATTAKVTVAPAATKSQAKPVACKKTAAPVAVRPVTKPSKVAVKSAGTAVAAKAPVRSVAVKAAAKSVAPAAPLAAPVAHRSSPLNTRVLSRAITLLASCGCTYEVVDAKGARYTNRVEATETPRRKRVNRFASTGYIARLRAMKVGDTITFDTRKYAPTAAHNFRGAVSGSGILAFGTGNFMTSLKGHIVEARRVG